jgi:nucleoside-diphosphate-sugar epimerase
MEKIALTGAGGVIGRGLRTDLARDYEVVAIDLAGSGAGVVADVRDPEALERAFAGCTTVVHLAGFSGVGTAWPDVFETNIGGTYNVFEAARCAGVRRVIFASSNHAVGMYEVRGGAALYERGAGVTVHAESDLRPDSLYGVGKVFGEALGRYFSETFGLQVTCIRIGSVLDGDSAVDPTLPVPSFLPHLTPAEARRRYAATWMSKRDFARLVRAIMERDVPFAIVYGVGDNLTRFWDLEPGRALFGFWPNDGTRLAG